MSTKGIIDNSLKSGPVWSVNFEKVIILVIFFRSFLIGSSLVEYVLPHAILP